MHANGASGTSLFEQHAHKPAYRACADEWFVKNIKTEYERQGGSGKKDILEFFFVAHVKGT